MIGSKYSPQLDVVVYVMYVLHRRAPNVVQVCEIMYREPRRQLPLFASNLCCDHSGNDVRTEMDGHESRACRKGYTNQPKARGMPWPENPAAMYCPS